MIQKTKEEVLVQLLARLEQKTKIVDVDPGTIALAFSEVLSELFSDFYKELDLITLMSYVSTASGQFLDLIGALVSCQRLTGETDNNYRSRITNQVYVVAGGNVISIRLKILSIEGVKDVILRRYTKGSGSFTAYIITDEPETPISILNAVEDVLEQAKSYGIFAEVRPLALVPVQLKVRLIFGDTVSDIEKASIRQTSKQNIKTYIDNIKPSGSFVINDIIQSVKSISNRIVDIDITSLKVSGVTQFARNFTINWDERVVIESLDVL